MAVFRVEKTRNFTVMSNHHLRNKELSLKAKGLQSLMLSLPESWDFTTKGLAYICKDGVDSITSALNELEQHGYLTRRRLRDERGRLTDIEYTIHEQPVEPENLDTKPFSPKRENPSLENPRQEKPILGKPEQGLSVLENPAQLSIDTNKQLKKINNNSSRTHLSIHPSIAPEAPGPPPRSRDRPDRMDGIDKDIIDEYREMIMDNIEYDCLIERYGRERLDGVVELMLETVCSKRPYIRIAGDEYPREVVKSRLLKLSCSHVEYVFDVLDKNTSKVHNIKAYLLTALYNAPATIDHYYRAEVNHDLYGP